MKLHNKYKTVILILLGTFIFYVVYQKKVLPIEGNTNPYKSFDYNLDVTSDKRITKNITYSIKQNANEQLIKIDLHEYKIYFGRNHTLKNFNSDIVNHLKLFSDDMSDKLDKKPLNLDTNEYNIVLASLSPTIEWERYYDRYGDFNSKNSARTKAWCEIHWNNHGRNEGRVFEQSITVNMVSLKENKKLDGFTKSQPTIRLKGVSSGNIIFYEVNDLSFKPPASIMMVEGTTNPNYNRIEQYTGKTWQKCREICSKNHNCKFFEWLSIISSMGTCNLYGDKPVVETFISNSNDIIRSKGDKIGLPLTSLKGAKCKFYSYKRASDINNSECKTYDSCTIGNNDGNEIFKRKSGIHKLGTPNYYSKLDPNKNLKCKNAQHSVWNAISEVDCQQKCTDNEVKVSLDGYACYLGEKFKDIISNSTIVNNYEECDSKCKTDDDCKGFIFDKKNKTCGILDKIDDPNDRSVDKNIFSCIKTKGLLPTIFTQSETGGYNI